MKLFVTLFFILAGIMVFKVFTRPAVTLPVDDQRMVVSDNSGPVPVVVELFRLKDVPAVRPLMTC